MTRNNYRYLAERRLAIIKKLRSQLQAEIRLNNVLAKMKFRPVFEQDPIKIRQLKQAKTMRDKANMRRAA